MDRYECHDWDYEGFPGEFVYGDGVYVDEEYMDERWKQIPGWDTYWCSDHGRIFGPGRDGKGHFLQLVLQNDYYKVTLSEHSRKKDKRVNCIIAQSFKPNPNNLPLVMHLDDDSKNNHADNLEWGTHAENNQHCWDVGRHPVTLNDEIREKAMKKRRTPVMAIDTSSGDSVVFNSQHDAARALGVMQQHVCGVLKGRRRTTGGYRFEYLDKEGCLDAY